MHKISTNESICVERAQSRHGFISNVSKNHWSIRVENFDFLMLCYDLMFSLGRVFNICI